MRCYFGRRWWWWWWWFANDRFGVFLGGGGGGGGWPFGIKVLVKNLVTQYLQTILVFPIHMINKLAM